jgi:hypothetical protein
MLESQMRVQLLNKVSVLLEKTGTFTAYEEKWLARALDMLFEVRSIWPLSLVTRRCAYWCTSRRHAR